MKKHIATAALCVFCTCCLADPLGVIYVAHDRSGTQKFSTQPYDGSYTAYSHAGTSLIRQTQESLAVPGRLVAFAAHIDHMAKKYDVDAALIAAVVEVESGFNARAISPKGAMGVMQLTPATAADYGVIDPYDPIQNLDGGTRYLKDLISAHQGNVALALAAYNAGKGRVAKSSQRIPPISETMLYVPQVLAKMAAYKRNREGWSQ